MEEEKKSRIYIGSDGIFNIIVPEILTEEDVREIIEEAKKFLERTLGKAKILIHMRTISIIHSSIFRKTTADKIKAIAEKPGYKKAAIFGPSVTLRTITNFIITASGVKNMRIFNSEKEALKWLKGS